MKKIYSELSRIQQELKAPKNLFNSFGNYYYRNAEGILEAVKPLLNGLALIINDEPIMIGTRFYIRATVTLTDGEESVSASAYAREDESKRGMDGCQLTGACSSYARKYALNALLMIDDGKDSDDDSLSPRNPKNKDKDPEMGPCGDPFTPPAPGKGKVSESPRLPVTVGDAFTSNMGEFMERFEIPDSQDALKKFNDLRKIMQEAGIIKKTDKMKTVEEVNDTFDAIYKNFNPKGELK